MTADDLARLDPWMRDILTKVEERPASVSGAIIFMDLTRTAIPRFAAEVARLRADSDKDAATLNAQANTIRRLRGERDARDAAIRDFLVVVDAAVKTRNVMLVLLGKEMAALRALVTEEKADG